ncbi:hypothetical protein EVAR_25289_1 [Eumeta japonica]|uniref:Uncharacterized protein n=1 Tax=Eumeta variegata TaxID=151549 RepID=A0A4C1VQ08_EUMVA|nr:hypothetical protein EVAR_25289_1 [Eumeta japonica]
MEGPRPGGTAFVNTVSPTPASGLKWNSSSKHSPYFQQQSIHKDATSIRKANGSSRPDIKRPSTIDALYVRCNLKAGVDDEAPQLGRDSSTPGVGGLVIGKEKGDGPIWNTLALC